MPETKTQKAVFSILMAFVMVYGMEVYNNIAAGRAAFTVPLGELLGLMLCVTAFQELFAGRLARKAAFKLAPPDRNPRLRVIVTVQIFTVCLMCPLMSAVAAAAFKGGSDAPFVLTWAETTAANFPMALAWQLLVAGPVVRRAVKLLTPR